MKVEKLIKDHWDYVNDLLKAHGTDTTQRNLIKFHYQSAFLHGYKHGKETEPETDLESMKRAYKKAYIGEPYR